ncbi:hypothetical protein CN288_12460 [Bacillus sp. AFS023182]|uniref:hypothetical protein n=1 Tax=Bacillus sp. AFS023182 TaxID=2033492 RepID=UPI000BF87318|nr:hypothetical protein [Bacillus sp. AFS023182]PFE03784.1 hypothetical protein CN288_12460 [Bacillus sp. AFS023182]
MEYHVPEVNKDRYVHISIETYEIKNPTSFDIRNLKGKGESHLTLALVFDSNDYSPDKFTHFFYAFNKFMDEFNAKNRL